MNNSNNQIKNSLEHTGRRLEEVPPGVYFEITRRCNLACKYCYAGKSENLKDPLDTHAIKKIITDIKNSGSTFIILSGGEPLIRDDFFEILDFTVFGENRNGREPKSFFPVSLVTNAVLITGETAEKLSRYPSLNIRISIDGHSPEFHDPFRGEGSFRKTMTGIKNLFKAGMRKKISLCSTITSQNVNRAGDMVKMALGLGIGSIVITPVVRQGRAGEIWDRVKISPDDLKRMFDELYQLEEKFGNRVNISGSMKSSLLKSAKSPLKEVKCPVGQRIAIDASGGVYPCSLMMIPEFLTGNMLEKPLKEIISGIEMKKYKKCALNRIDEIEKCIDCKYRNTCNGGCMARAYMEKGDLYSPDPDCRVILELIESNKK